MASLRRAPHAGEAALGVVCSAAEVATAVQRRGRIPASPRHQVTLAYRKMPRRFEDDHNDLELTTAVRAVREIDRKDPLEQSGPARRRTAAGHQHPLVADRVSSSCGEADARPGVPAGSANLDSTRLLLRSRTDEPSQGWAVDWFLQKSIERPDVASGLVFCGADENQHRRSVEAIPLTDLGGQSSAIGIRHLKINQHGIEVRLGQQGARLGCGADCMASMP